MEKGAHLRLVFGRASKAIETIDRQSIGETGLKVTDFMILEALLHKGPMPINIIGEKVLLTSGSMTTAAKRLEKQGLVQRVDDPSDGRRCYLHLTKTGLSLTRNAFQAHSATLNELFSCLTDEEQSEFIRLLKKVGTHAQTLT
ncbi:MAG: MarR family transcriptional regulator [Desulfobulbaceae bacterium]|nr:MAG: MarR family transcriptional regulator [Desulfobulbaceae bacterium]